MPIKTTDQSPRAGVTTATTRDDLHRQPGEVRWWKQKAHRGRNSTGRVTSRFIGGGAKQAYRVVDFSGQGGHTGGGRVD